jgi:hypothetical protein
MPTTTTATKNPLKSAQTALTNLISYNDFLDKLGAKDRLNAEKHVAACEGSPAPGHAKLWKKLACAMMTLSSNLAKVNGQQSVQFYVPDGKYRKQVFALEDLRKEYITVYCDDCLDDAVKAKLLRPTKDEEDGVAIFGLPKSDETLTIERINGSTVNPAEFFKHMVGWHRQALRINVPLNASDEQVNTVLTLCALHAQPAPAAAT